MSKSEYLKHLYNTPRLYLDVFPASLNEREVLVIKSFWSQSDEFIRKFITDYRSSNDTMFDFATKFYITMFLVEMGGEKGSMRDIVQIIKNKLENIYGISFDDQVDTISGIVEKYLTKPDNSVEDLNKWFAKII